jgi:aryl-alcohol dehydrogenase-like predicted oxidoreductase
MDYVDLGRADDARPFVASAAVGASSLDQPDAGIDAFETPWTAILEAAIEARHHARPNPCPRRRRVRP